MTEQEYIDTLALVRDQAARAMLAALKGLCDAPTFPTPGAWKRANDAVAQAEAAGIEV